MHQRQANERPCPEAGFDVGDQQQQELPQLKLRNRFTLQDIALATEQAQQLGKGCRRP